MQSPNCDPVALRTVARTRPVRGGAAGPRSVARRGVWGARSGMNYHSESQFGAFIFSDPSMQPIGEVSGSHLLDMAPTLMDCAGYDIPKAMQGRSLCGRHFR